MTSTKIPVPEYDSKTYLIVLTATIAPSQNVQIVRSDPQQRQQDYIRAFRFWLKNEDPRLTRMFFIENSGANLDIFRQIASEENFLGKEIEIRSAPQRAIPPGMHYGWGELKMLDDGLRDSDLIRSCSHFIKATGRLTFPTIRNLLDKAPQDFDALVDSRIPTLNYRKGLNLIQALKKREGAYASTQLLLVRKGFYDEHLVSLADSMRPFTDSAMIERVLYDKLLSLRGTCSIRFRFPVNCEPSGVGAEIGQIYDRRSRKIVSKLRALLRGTGVWI